jgi:hypothetical protein
MHVGAAADAAAANDTLAPQRRAALDTALLETRWVNASEPAGATATDPLGVAVERALATEQPAQTHVYAPLLGVEPIGVVAFEFAALAAADRATRDGTVVVEQLAMGCEALLRAHRARLRLERCAALAHAVHRLHESAGTDDFASSVASEAARLVGARRAFVRRVDEVRRTYSLPAASGVDPGRLAEWRSLDARITERTLSMRQALLTTAADDRSEPGTAPSCSLISVPLAHAGQIVGVLNVYEKQPQDFLERDAFTSFDRDLLESLGMVLAMAFAPHAAPGAGLASPPGRGAATSPGNAPPAGTVAAPRPGTTASPRETSPPETTRPLAATSPPLAATPLPAPLPRPAAPVVPAGEAASGSTSAAGEPAARVESSRTRGAAIPIPESATTPQAILQFLVQEAAREQRSLGVWLLHFEGLTRLGDASESARRTLAATVQRGLRGGDQVAWVSEQDLAVFGFEPPPPSVGLEARLADAVRPQLSRIGRPLDNGIELRIGTSVFPEDGSDPIRLLASAAERSR